MNHRCAYVAHFLPLGHKDQKSPFAFGKSMLKTQNSAIILLLTLIVEGQVSSHNRKFELGILFACDELYETKTAINLSYKSGV